MSVFPLQFVENTDTWALFQTYWIFLLAILGLKLVYSWHYIYKYTHTHIYIISQYYHMLYSRLFLYKNYVYSFLQIRCNFYWCLWKWASPLCLETFSLCFTVALLSLFCMPWEYPNFLVSCLFLWTLVRPFTFKSSW